MCYRIISHYTPCLHQRCTSLEICSRNRANPGADPFDCEIGGPVFVDEPSIDPCPVCLGELERRVERAGEAWREVGRNESGAGEGEGGERDVGSGEDGERNPNVWAEVPWSEINEEILRQGKEGSSRVGDVAGEGWEGEGSKGGSLKRESLKGEYEGAKGKGDDERLNARWAEMMRAFAEESSKGSEYGS